MPRFSLSSRWLLIAGAGTLLVAVSVGLASQPAPGDASTPSPFLGASVQGSPSSPSSVSDVRPTERVVSPAGQQGTPLGSASPIPTFVSGEWLTLGQLLASLPVTDEHRAGYLRALFPLWVDADGNGCNTRQEVLIAEAVVAPTVGVGCSLSGGTWRSLYDGQVISAPSLLDIDHVVALAEAWDSGAFAWSTDRRLLFANALDVSWALIAVSASSNRTKSDNDPADWVPPDPSDLCRFVSSWIAIKARWALSVDPREGTALAGLILNCPNGRMPFVPAPAGEPAPIPTSAGGCSPAYPTVCIPPPPPDLNCADIPFRRFKVLPPDPHSFDGNKNGIGCESG